MNFNLLNKGTIVFADLDNFQDCMKIMGWSRYSPNEITRLMTNRVQRYINRYQATLLWGLNKAEGTEEFILIFLQDIERVIKIMNKLRKDILELARKLNAPTSLSVGLTYGEISHLKVLKSHKKKEFLKHPTIYLAYKALKKAKKKGGNELIKI
jgi:GGDEF domain-containing protein